MKKFVKKAQNYLEGLNEIFENNEGNGNQHFTNPAIEEDSANKRKGGNQAKEKDSNVPKSPVSALQLFANNRIIELAKMAPGIAKYSLFSAP